MRVATLAHGAVSAISPDGTKAALTPCPDILTTNCCFAAPGLSTLYVTLSTTGKHIAFDNRPTRGVRLNFQA